MAGFSVERQIAARPEVVWAILTDAPLLAGGGFGILRIDGDIRDGARIKLWSEADPKRGFALRVVEFARPERMVWQGGMPFGLFTGRREFTIDPLDRGCRFRMSERFSGPLAGPICRAMPDLQPLFDRFGDRLKEQAEGAT